MKPSPNSHRCGQEAGRIQMLHFGHSHPVQYKEEFNPVTEVDRLCERAIVEKISGVFPDHDILTEESPLKGKDLSLKWIIDPPGWNDKLFFTGFPVSVSPSGSKWKERLRWGWFMSHPSMSSFMRKRARGPSQWGKDDGLPGRSIEQKSFMHRLSL